jgi:hypothetical protein
MVHILLGVDACPDVLSQPAQLGDRTGAGLPFLQQPEDTINQPQLLVTPQTLGFGQQFLNGQRRPPCDACWLRVGFEPP